jgi:hypothetical protein
MPKHVPAAHYTVCGGRLTQPGQRAEGRRPSWRGKRVGSLTARSILMATLYSEHACSGSRMRKHSATRVLAVRTDLRSRSIYDEHAALAAGRYAQSEL